MSSLPLYSIRQFSSYMSQAMDSRDHQTVRQRLTLYSEREDSVDTIPDLNAHLVQAQQQTPNLIPLCLDNSFYMCDIETLVTRVKLYRSRVVGPREYYFCNICMLIYHTRQAYHDHFHRSLCIPIVPVQHPTVFARLRSLSRRFNSLNRGRPIARASATVVEPASNVLGPLVASSSQVDKISTEAAAVVKEKAKAASKTSDSDGKKVKRSAAVARRPASSDTSG